MNLRGIIFDLDGTLADTLPVCVQSFQTTIEHFRGRRPDPEEIYALFGTNEEGILERSVPGRLEETLPYFLSVYEDLHSSCQKPFPGIQHAFETILSKNMTAAIVTGKGQHSAAISMRILGLDRYVNLVETGFQDRADKPRCINRVLHSWNYPPSQAAYVGDAAYDMLAAQEAGVLPLGAAWAESSELLQMATPLAFTAFYTIPSFIKWLEAI
jgi:pyrophosphatase PpaX